jgi:hypothetical protein
MHMTNLEPYIFFRQRPWRVIDNIAETLRWTTQLAKAKRLDCKAIYLEALLVLRLLFVDYTETKIDLVGLLEIGLHTHDLREGFFGELKRPIAVVENTNAIPEFGILPKVNASV